MEAGVVQALELYGYTLKHPIQTLAPTASPRHQLPYYSDRTYLPLRYNIRNFLRRVFVIYVSEVDNTARLIPLPSTGLEIPHTSRCD